MTLRSSSKRGFGGPDITEVEGVLTLHDRFSARQIRRGSVSAVNFEGQILFRQRISLYYKHIKSSRTYGCAQISIPPKRAGSYCIFAFPSVGIPGLESGNSPNLGFLPMSVLSSYPKGTTIVTSKTLLTLWSSCSTVYLAIPGLLAMERIEVHPSRFYVHKRRLFHVSLPSTEASTLDIKVSYPRLTKSTGSCLSLLIEGR